MYIQSKKIKKIFSFLQRLLFLNIFSKIFFLRLTSLFLCVLFNILNYYPNIVWANPQDGKVISGKAEIIKQSSTPSLLEINQTTDKAIINWQKFNINFGETTRFNVPSFSSITLNRVLGGEISKIFGNLQSNGRIFLINSAGIHFSPNAAVDVAGLLASTLDISDENFLDSNKYIFTNETSLFSSIINEGTIKAKDSGFVALIAPLIENKGTINAKMGSVLLASGKTVIVDLTGDDLLSFSVSGNGGLYDEFEVETEAGVVNVGSIIAEGGNVTLTAKTLDNVLDSLINVSGVIDVSIIEEINGEVVLSGNKKIKNNNVISNNKLHANEKNINKNKINIEGDKVLLQGKLIADGLFGGEIDIKANDLFLIGEISAKGKKYDGGKVTFNVGEDFWGTSSSIIDVTGFIDGGSIINYTKDKIFNSGKYIAKGLSGIGGNVEFAANYINNFYADFDVFGLKKEGNIIFNSVVQTNYDNLDNFKTEKELESQIINDLKILSRGELKDLSYQQGKQNLHENFLDNQEKNISLQDEKKSKFSLNSENNLNALKVKDKLNKLKKFDLEVDDKNHDLIYVLDFLKKFGFSKDGILSYSNNGHTILTLALKLNLNKKFIEKILNADKKGVLANFDYIKENRKGEKFAISPIELAIENNSPEKVLLLLKNNADFNQIIKNTGKTLYEFLAEDKNNKFDTNWDPVKEFLIAKNAHTNKDIYYNAHPPTTSIVFEGGGAKGVVYIGAMRAMEERPGFLENIERVGGDSIGSLFALFVALGASSSEMENYLDQIDLKKLFEIPTKEIVKYLGYLFFDKVGNIVPDFKKLQYLVPGMLTRKQGIYKTEKLRLMIDEKIEFILGKKNATFRDLHEARAIDPRFKDLYVQLANVTTRKGEVFSFENHPDAVISEVVMASMSVPFAFEPYQVEENGKFYTYVDGGIHDNFPVLSMFNREKYLPKGYNFDRNGANPGVYLFKVDNKLDMSNLLWNKGLPKGKSHYYYDPLTYGEDVIDILWKKDQFVAEMYPPKIIQIEDGGIRTFDFKITKKDIEKAVDRGYKTTTKHFENYNDIDTYYFKFDPKTIDDKEMSLIDRVELKPWSSKEQLINEKNKLLDEVNFLRTYNYKFYQGRSKIMLKREYYRRIKDINYRLLLIN